jgi:hypothetical protein
MAAPVLSAAEFHGAVKFSGLAVPGVTVTVTLEGKTYIAITNPQGVYTFKDLPDGSGTIQVEMLGFIPIKQDMTISSKVPFNPTWELKLQSFDEIKASAPPPSTAPTTATVATSAATSAPAGGAAPTTAAAKDNPPAAPTAPAAGKGKFQKADVNATGQKNAAAPAEPAEAASDDSSKTGAADGFLVNGSVNNGAASPFAQSAAFGNNRRAGRSLYNGSFGFILDNSITDARQFSVTGQDIPKGAYSQITGRASFGGPIKWPRNTRYPVQIFLNYAWTHNRTDPTSSPQLMPSEAFRTGNFSSALNPIGIPLTVVDPTTGLAFPGNIIPGSRLSPQAQALVQYYPQPNFNSSNPAYNFETAQLGITHQDSGRANFNKQINQKDSINGLFAIQSSRGFNTSVLGFLDTTDSLGMNSQFNWTHRVNSHVFLTFGYQFSRFSLQTIPFFANQTNVSGNAGIGGNNQQAVNWGPPTLGFSSGVASLTDATYASNHNQTSAPSFQTYWNHNPHNFRFGGDYRRLEFNYLTQSNPRGSFFFNGTATGTTGVPGSDFADFMLGIPDASQIAFGNADKYLRETLGDVYISDDWRVNSSLTLTLGARWDYNGPIAEKYGRLVNLDIGPDFSAISPVLATNPVGSLTNTKYPNSLINPDYAGFQPRLALAWRPLPASSLVVRAGYGVNYNTSVFQSIYSALMQQPPFSKAANLTNSATTPLTLANGFTSAPNAITNTFGIDPNFRIGYVQTWNLAIQRDLPWALAMTATYQGNKGTRQVQVFDPNTYPQGETNPCLTCPSGFAYMVSNGNSTRESGNLQLRRRLHNGFTSSLNYTYSKSIDDAALGGRATGGSVIAQNWLDLDGERGLSPFDQRHVVTLSGQYSTGVGLGGGALMSGWRGRLFKDWTFLTNISAGTGLPENPTDSAIIVAGLTGPARPEYLGGSIYTSSGGSFLNRAAYGTPPSGQWGNAGRDTITGPSQFSLGASAMRTFRLNDRFNADLRVDSTNTLNRVIFSSWVSNISSSQFGQPGAANAPRKLQTTFTVRF